MELKAIRSSSSAKTGRQYWRSLDELAQSDEFTEVLHREFPKEAAFLTDDVSRRNFVKLMGASLALGGLTACARQPEEKIIPYVKPPEEMIPGKAMFFASAMQHRGFGFGILAESHEGRPTKVDGLPGHPANLGSSDIITQASILSLYDPDRSKSINAGGRINTLAGFETTIAEAMGAQRGKKGAGVRILTETVTSPTLASQLDMLLKQFSEAKWHTYEPAGRENVREGAKLAFGEYVNTIYHFDKADRVLALDADFLTEGPAAVRYARDFAAKRGDFEGMNRLYAVETAPTATGSNADHRLPLRYSDVEAFARALGAALGLGGAPDGPASSATFLTAVVDDLNAHKGSSIVVAGEQQSPAVHALAHAINAALGNVGKTVTYTEAVEANPANNTQSLQDLATDMEAGTVDILVILDANPVYSAPADINFADALTKVGLRVHLSEYLNETSTACDWHLPKAHYLETWSDVKAFDGTASIVQPLIAPLYDGVSPHQVIAAMLDQSGSNPYDSVQAYWRSQWSAEEFDAKWRTALSDGFVADSALPAKAVTAGAVPAGDVATASGYDIVFREDPSIGDGRWANNGWLQEVPKPISKITWDNCAYMSQATADALDVGFGDMVKISVGEGSVDAPACVLFGHADDTITVHLGFGRTVAGRVGDGVGFDPRPIRSAKAMSSAAGASVAATGRDYLLARTEDHFLIEQSKAAEDRFLVREIPVQQLPSVGGHDIAHLGPHVPGEKDSLILSNDHDWDQHAWAMAIDLNLCNGCNACIVSCQSENNIPVVGKEQVARGREMQWIRVDRYFRGDAENPEIVNQPVPCMQCENAPCEVVCPVAATVHSKEGLNDMVYNRCIGTRYCSNNCPYKVRRFNFLHFNRKEVNSGLEPSMKLLRNPNVTVRSRGVMEKCTYCVQRINTARITAKKEDRRVRDGEITTACQQACPANAITFGDKNDTSSAIAGLRHDKRNYGVLADLGTRPRTTYLAKVRNPNEALGPVEFVEFASHGAAGGEDHGEAADAGHGEEAGH